MDPEDTPPPSGERRDTPRQPIELKVEYKRLNTFFSDYTKNISRGGTFIKTNRPLPIGTGFVFKLFVPTLTQPLVIHGEVQRIVADDGSGEEPGMAIRFVHRDGSSPEDVDEVVEQLMVSSLGARISAKLMDVARRRGE